MPKTKMLKTLLQVGMFVLVVLLMSQSSVVAKNAKSSTNQGKWWNVLPEEENPSPYYDSILYSEIAPKLREIEKNSNRVKVDLIGQSAGGRDLFLVTISNPQAMGRLGKYQAIRNTMLKDPEKAQDMITKFGDFKVPVYINGSIHGNEYPGVDAAIRLIETLAYENSEEVQNILDNVILLVNVVQNPDGRVMGTRRNANGFDINRDFIAQTQPETRATVKIFTEWNPMVVLDLHGFVNPMLIEPCTPPHNPNYEYDLYIQWAYDQALAMEAELVSLTSETTAYIPYRDWALGWDDWSLSYAPMYAMYHGSYGHTLETPHRDERGVDALYAAVWGSLKFVAENRENMVYDQVEIFRRGYLDLLQQPIPPELLPEYPQYQDLMIQDFPAAYVIPVGPSFQISPHQPARLIDFLLFNDVQVEQASQSFYVNGDAYPKGSYIIWLDQPKRGLANVILDDGLDLSDIPGLYFYSPPSVWSHPRLWGVELAVMEDKLDIATNTVNKPDSPKGSVENGEAGAYAYFPTSISAFRATNELLTHGFALYRSHTPFTDNGRNFGAGAIIFSSDSALANALANVYALDIIALTEAPEEAVPMYQQKIAVYGDEGVEHCLKTLGFVYDSVDIDDLNAEIIDEYDVFVNRWLRWDLLDTSGSTSISQWFTDGGDYIGLGYRGRAIDFANDAGWVAVDYEEIPGNSIIEIDYSPLDSVSAGFPENGYAFVYGSVLFTEWNDMEVSAWIGSNDFLVSGFWPDWEISGAEGMPIIIHKSDEIADVTFVGIDNTFRGHPEDTFRILGNAIYNGID